MSLDPSNPRSDHNKTIPSQGGLRNHASQTGPSTPSGGRFHVTCIARYSSAAPERGGFILLNLVSLFQSYRFPSLKLRPASSLLSPIPIKQSSHKYLNWSLHYFVDSLVYYSCPHILDDRNAVFILKIYTMKLGSNFFYYLQLYQRFVVHLRRDVPSNIIEKKLKLLYFLNIILKVQRNRV